MANISNHLETGRRIRQLRIMRGCTQAEFAEAIDISINFLSEIENGKKGLSQDTLSKICQQFSISADYLLFGRKTDQLSLMELASALSVEELETVLRYINALIDMKKMDL